MKRILCVVFFAMLLFLFACSQACEICGRDHKTDISAGLAGASSRNAYFEVFAPATTSNESLRVYVASCWSGSITPEYRLGFVAKNDIADLYSEILIAESNAPFGATLHDDTIILTSDIIGLEEILILTDDQHREVGYAYTIKRTVVPSTPNTRQPSIMVNDTYYFITGLSVSVEINEDGYLGRVISETPLSDIPLENGQSNFATEGTPYAAYEDGIIVLINGRWILFESWDDDLVRDYVNH